MAQRPTVLLTDNEESGFWRIIASPANGGYVDLTVFRDVPTQIESMSTQDPFGPTEATITLPAVTMLDRYGPGAGDLEWLTPEVNISMFWFPNWQGTYVFDDPTMPYFNIWEGYAVDFGWSFSEASGALTLQLRGAMYQLDNYLAMQEYLSRPITFEHAILRQFNDKRGLRVRYPGIEWPDWWDKHYDADVYKGQPPYLRPIGVENGQHWTGMLTRETGQRDQALTSYIQGLLSAMYTERGQWTLMLNPGRLPVLKHREHLLNPDSAQLYVDLLQPGLDVELNQDYTQRANVVWGRGRSLAGVTYSGMQVTPSGQRTYYEPFAALDPVHPDSENNTRFDGHLMRKEINLDFYEGMSADDAIAVANDHLRRFSDPGITGQLTLTASDPKLRATGKVYPRQLVQAGMNIRLDGLFGQSPGPVFHITEAEVSPTNNTTTLTVDTRFRDALTVQEVRQRGRDSLQVARMLTVGNYQPNIPDQLLPWDYELGSGALPLGSKDYFKGAPDDLQFPWTAWVREHPPEQFGSAFVKVDPTDYWDASNNWNRPTPNLPVGEDPGPAGYEVGNIAPLLLSQMGDVKLLQVAAFWGDGRPAQVAFHLSIYRDYAVSAMDTPALPANFNAGGGRQYKEGDYYPFFKDAWETVNEEGEEFNTQFQVAADGTGMEVGYGNYYAKAGYWPKAYSPAEVPTGMLVDESGFNYDGSTHPDFDPTDRTNNTFDESGRFGVLIYCDDQGAQPVYFIGRAWRREYGTS